MTFGERRCKGERARKIKKLGLGDAEIDKIATSLVS
jgi:hypothetical protein